MAGMAGNEPPPAYVQDPSNVPTAQPAPVMMAPPGIYYNPNDPQPIVMIQQPPDYDYIPSNYLNLSFFMTVLCGIFSPLMVFFTIPAIILGLKSRNAHKMGDIEVAKNYGLIAAYLNFFAVIVGFVVAFVATGLVIGLYIY